MKSKWLLIILIAVVCIAAIAQTQGPNKQTSASQESRAMPRPGIIPNTESSNDGVLHSTSFGKKWFADKVMSGYFLTRIHKMTADSSAELPYTIQPEGVYTTDKNPEWDKMATEIQNFIPRVGWTRASTSENYIYVARLTISARFHTFIFASQQLTFKGEPPLDFFLTNVDTNGYFISSLNIGLLYGLPQIRTAEIDAGGIIQCHTLRQIWEHDPLQYGYEHNKVKERVSIAEKTYQITPSGDIVLRR